MVVRRYKVPDVRRELLFCPRCGTDLDNFRPRRIGDLFADPVGETYWKGQRVELNSTQRIILHSLLTMKHVSRRKTEKGFFVSAEALAERVDATYKSIPVQIAYIRNAFRNVDPDFNHIEVSWGHGWRWSQKGEARNVIARMMYLVLHDDGTLLWLNKHRFYLTHKQTSFMKVLMDAKGDWVTGRQLIERAGFKNLTGPNYHSLQLRKLFKQAEPSKVLLETKSGGKGSYRGGYRINDGRDN